MRRVVVAADADATRALLSELRGAIRVRARGSQGGMRLDQDVIDPALPSKVADTAPGRTQQPVRFTGYEPVSAWAARQWRATYAYIRDTVPAADSPAGGLIAASAARLLVATALAVFQQRPDRSDQHRPARRPPRHPASRGHLHRRARQ